MRSRGVIHSARGSCRRGLEPWTEQDEQWSWTVLLGALFSQLTQCRGHSGSGPELTLGTSSR